MLLTNTSHTIHIQLTSPVVPSRSRLLVIRAICSSLPRGFWPMGREGWKRQPSSVASEKREGWSQRSRNHSLHNTGSLQSQNMHISWSLVDQPKSKTSSCSISQVWRHVSHPSSAANFSPWTNQLQFLHFSSFSLNLATPE